MMRSTVGYAVGSRSISGVSCGEVKEDVCYVVGFQTLTSNMAAHITVSQAYFLMLALMLGQPVKTVPNATKVSQARRNYYKIKYEHEAKL